MTVLMTSVPDHVRLYASNIFGFYLYDSVQVNQKQIYFDEWTILIAAAASIPVPMGKWKWHVDK
jgi:hypothetical protein